MLKKVYNKNAQVVMSEYVLVFFVIVGVMTTMTIFFRRAIQARIYDARNTMIKTVAIQGGAGNDVKFEYEPYYLNTDTTITRRERTEKKLLRSLSLSSGIAEKNINEITAAQVISVTAPPQEAD